MQFGCRPLTHLLQKEKLRALVRAHQVQETGYLFHSWHGDEEFPPCITVFSAPNYCGHGNEAALMISDGEAVDVRTFNTYKKKPYVLQDRQDAFSYYHADLTAGILHTIHHILKIGFSRGNQRVGRILSKTESIDPQYLQRIISESKTYDSDQKPKPSRGKTFAELTEEDKAKMS